MIYGIYMAYIYIWHTLIYGIYMAYYASVKRLVRGWRQCLGCPPLPNLSDFLPSRASGSIWKAFSIRYILLAIAIDVSCKVWSLDSTLQVCDNIWNLDFSSTGLGDCSYLTTYSAWTSTLLQVGDST